MSEYSVLQKATRSDVQSDPFPFIVIPDAIPADLYDDLAASFPSAEKLGIDTEKSNVRWDYSTHQVIADPSLPAIWRQFIEYHASQAFLDEILHLFQDDILKIYPDRFPSPKTLRSMRAGIRKHSRFRNADVLMDAQISGNTAVTNASSVRTTHLDQGNKLYSGLFYMKPEGYDAVGGDLTISRFAGDLAGKAERFSHIRNSYVDDKDVEHVQTVTYDRNLVVLFINTLDSLHGVTVRQPTDKARLFVNLIGEVKPPLYYTDADRGYYAGTQPERAGGGFLKKLSRRLLRA